MLITMSGMVGSGKSTSAKRVAQLLDAAGVECRYLRFRSFGLLGFRARPEKSTGESALAAVPSQGSRWPGFELRRLTAAITCGYVARIVAFRLFGRPGRARCYVLDRFFYDSFVHYSLRTPRERIYAAVLRRMIPKPDLAVLLLASPETIATRRPEYDTQYVQLAGRGYDALRGLFPELVTVSTNPGEQSMERLDALVRDRLARSGLPHSRVRREVV